MNQQQICQLLIDTPIKQNRQKCSKSYEDIQSNVHQLRSDEIQSKLQQILNCLQEEKIQFQVALKKQHQDTIQKINIQKDQIIEELLKTIYNLKRQNEQLNFQFKRRFKVIKNIENKYENLILIKNKKITEMQSIIKYLEKKIKYNEKKLVKLQNSTYGDHFSNQQFQPFSKSLSQKDNIKYTTTNNNKISLIISKPSNHNNKFNQKHNHISRNSLEDLTIPLKSSLISQSKITSSSKTIAKHSKNSEYFVQRDPKQSMMFSSLLYSTQQYLNDKTNDQQTRFQEASRIRPICLQKSVSSTSNYLNLEDFQDIDRFQNLQRNQSTRSMRRSQQIKVTQPLTYRNRFKNNQ